MIINVTGGPDLSLVEVSEASSIVQEAADEDANIIFGAVIDPALKGKVKITVIATGFGRRPPRVPATSGAQTPVDMTQYAETPAPAWRRRAAARSAAAAERAVASQRLSIARRPARRICRCRRRRAATADAPPRRRRAAIQTSIWARRSTSRRSCDGRKGWGG